jgi:hypothetical protein
MPDFAGTRGLPMGWSAALARQQWGYMVATPKTFEPSENARCRLLPGLVSR